MNPWIIIGWIVLVSMIVFYVSLLVDFIKFYSEEKEREHQRLHDRTRSE